MYCRNCGKTVNEKAVACTNCGVAPLSEKHFCHECGTETKENQVICVKCGVSLETNKKKGLLGNIKLDSKGEYEGFYRSSDDKVIFGLCGGLAHKFGVATSTMRIVVFISGFFMIGWAYLVAPALPKYPTKDK